MIYDISILQGSSDSAPAEVGIAAEEGGYASQGAVKRAHQFLVALMTVAGEVPADPDAGTSFAGALLSGSLRSEDAIVFAFNEARTQILQKFMEEETASTPAEDIVTSVDLQGVSVARGFALIRFRVATEGGSASVVVPVKNPGVTR